MNASSGLSVAPAGRARTRIQLLDSFQVCRAGEIVSLPMSARRVIAFLALRSHPLLRTHVAGVALARLARRSAAFANLRSALWRIHRTGRCSSRRAATRFSSPLTSESISTRRPHVARRLIGSVPMGAGADVDWLSLTGEVLPDWDDDWALVEREHHRNLSLQALESLGEHLPRRAVCARRSRSAWPCSRASRCARARTASWCRSTWPRATPSTRSASSGSTRPGLQRLGIEPSAQMLDLMHGLLRDGLDVTADPIAAA